ncbi:MAG: 3'-5' exonuclease [Bacteroidales bacterium]|nr:3'-5' exonuclease [Bacteroidales bacterium]
MKDFAAIDFETANKEFSSICAVGLVIVRGGKIVDHFYSLVKPYPNYYPWFYTRVHGIKKKDTENAPLFPEVWKQVIPKIVGLPLVAHNKSFDETCLKTAYKHYHMKYPNYPFYCTLQKSMKDLPSPDMIENHRLPTVASYCGYELKDHHNALADAEACAYIAMKLL